LLLGVEMGKQISFFMTHVDELSLIRALEDEANVVVALNSLPTPEPVILDPLPPVGEVDVNDVNLSIFNKDIDPKLIVESVRKGVYHIDLTRSEVIQFNRCFIASDGRLEPGRLWYDHETMRCKPKRKAFLAWAQSVFRFIKKHYHYSKSHFRHYFGADAWARFEDGQLTLPSHYPPIQGGKPK